MDLQLVPVAQFQTFLLCLARVIALVAAIPAFAGVAASVRMKLGLAVATALVLFPLMAPHTPQVDFTLTGFGLLMVNEVLLGALHRLRDEGNTLFVVEHNPLVISAADWIVDTISSDEVTARLVVSDLLAAGADRAGSYWVTKA